jgi:hypothetical protein
MANNFLEQLVAEWYELRDTLAGGKLILGNELLEIIFADLQNRSIYSHTIPEQFPILRVFQLVAQYRKEVCSILLSK